MKMPFDPLSGSSAVRHILIKHAKVAGLDAPTSAAMSFATLMPLVISMGTRARVLSGLLGHRDPESVSAYARIATESLREVSLPVPT
jgi:site-specific recombinase XerD